MKYTSKKTEGWVAYNKEIFNEPHQLISTVPCAGGDEDS